MPMKLPKLQPSTLLPACVAACLIAFTASPLWGDPGKAEFKTRKAETKIIDSMAIRYANADTTDTPDFQKHVIPLLGRLGCNGRACHGSFQGRGGFQLSLFGYDFAADHAAMLDESSGRVDINDVDESLILAKPVDADAHEGGKRFDEGSWQFHVLRKWITEGAKHESVSPQKLVE